MSSKNILFTANHDISTPFWHYADDEKSILHLPLEQFHYGTDPETTREVQNHWDQISFIIIGSLRNTRYFLQWVDVEKMLENVQKKVTIVSDQASSSLIEQAGIPAILPANFARAIDIIEFLLRISREGVVLYPCSEQQTEEIPGLLKELEMPVIEFPVCREENLDESTLQKFRDEVKTHAIDTILFHNRSSVVRIKTAFSRLRFDDITCIAADKGVAIKMKEEGIEPDKIASGSWKSLAKSVLNVP